MEQYTTKLAKDIKVGDIIADPQDRGYNATVESIRKMGDTIDFICTDAVHSMRLPRILWWHADDKVKVVLPDFQPGDVVSVTGHTRPVTLISATWFAKSQQWGLEFYNGDDMYMCVRNYDEVSR